MPTLTCTRCGMDWHRTTRQPRRPALCPECAPVIPRQRTYNRGNPNYDAVLTAVNLRLAHEMAVPLIRLGRYAEALAILEPVQAPTR